MTTTFDVKSRKVRKILSLEAKMAVLDEKIEKAMVPVRKLQDQRTILSGEVAERYMKLKGGEMAELNRLKTTITSVKIVEKGGK